MYQKLKDRLRYIFFINDSENWETERKGILKRSRRKRCIKQKTYTNVYVFVLETGIYISYPAVSSSHFVLFTCHTKLYTVTTKHWLFSSLKKSGLINQAHFVCLRFRTSAPLCKMPFYIKYVFLFWAHIGVNIKTSFRCA